MLVVCAALVIIGSYTWRHKEQTLAIINQLKNPGQILATTANQESIESSVATAKIPAGDASVETTSSTTSVVPILELTKVPLTGDTESFTTLDGDLYSGVVKRVEPDGIVLRTSDGVPKLKFKNLSPEVAQKYGYDPEIETRYLTYLAKASAAREKLAIAVVSETKRRVQQAAETAAAMNQPPLHIKVNQVISGGVLADLMETASVGSRMSRIGGGGAVCTYYKPSGHIIYVTGVNNVVDNDELSIKAKRDGVYSYVDTLGASRTVEKYTLLSKVGN